MQFSGMAAVEAFAVVLHGSTNQIVDVSQGEHLLRDAVTVLSQTDRGIRIVLGGGCSLKMPMKRAVDETAIKANRKSAIAVEPFVHALQQIRTIRAENAGYNANDFVTYLWAPQ